MVKIVKVITLAVAALLYAGSVSAVPARRTKVTVRQSDGTEIVVSLRGDEHFHYFVTDDGLPLVREANGDFCHAVVEDGSIASSAIMAHDVSRRTEQERTFIARRGDINNDINLIHRAKMERRNAGRMRNAVNARTGVQKVYEGDKRALVILVNFKDNAFSIPSPKEHYLRKLNERGYSENNCHGSASQYFSDQSSGVFNLTFDVAGPYTLSQNMAYYGENVGGVDGNDKNPRAMIREACELASADVDYSNYDWYGDGYVDLVFVVFAGYSESQWGAPETVWPHQWDLGTPVTINDKKIYTYACSGELAGRAGTTPDGIGTFCHEFSHCLGLPDFYNTAGGKAVFGMSSWSLMDYGTYLGAGGYGECPCNYTAYERWCCGWAAPTELASATTVRGMLSLDSGNNGYIIYNDAHRDEFYVLDNRQKEGWDTYLPGHGLLVTHVDYDEKIWYNNNVNVDASHPRCTIINADNSTETENNADLAGDPFPGATGNTSLTDISTPAATLFNAAADGRKFMGKPVTDITESEDGLISFKFMGGSESGVSDAVADGVLTDGEAMPDCYRQLLPREIRLKKRYGKTVKVINR